MGRVLDELNDILSLIGPGSANTVSQPYSEWYNELTDGVSTVPRGLAQSATGLAAATGVLRMAHFTSPKSFTSSQVRLFTGTTAAGATPTLCRAGLYTIAADGAGTLVASFANDTTLFAAANTLYTKSWTTPYALVKGTRYAVGVLVVTGATAPTLTCCAFSSAQIGSEFGLAPRLGSSLAGQADLPASFTLASTTALGARLYAALAT